jgi:hypothetical protein
MPSPNPGLSQVDNDRLSPVKQDANSLFTSLDKTNLDTTDPKPFNTPVDPTVYPKTTMASTPGRGFNPTTGKPAEKFVQKYSSNNSYLDSLNGNI